MNCRFDVLRKQYPLYLPAFLIAMHCGMRASEQWRAGWEDVNFETGIPTVRQTKNGPTGPPPRYVPMNAVVRRCFQQLLKERQTQKYAFVNTEGGRLRGHRDWFEPTLKKSVLRDYWSLRRIEGTTGVCRETAAGYLRSAGIIVRLPRSWQQKSLAKVATSVTTGSGLPVSPPEPDGKRSDSVSEVYREIIALELSRGRNAMGIWQHHRDPAVALAPVLAGLLLNLSGNSSGVWRPLQFTGTEFAGHSTMNLVAKATPHRTKIWWTTFTPPCTAAHAALHGPFLLRRSWDDPLPSDLLLTLSDDTTLPIYSTYF